MGEGPAETERHDNHENDGVRDFVGDIQADDGLLANAEHATQNRVQLKNE